MTNMNTRAIIGAVLALTLVGCTSPAVSPPVSSPASDPHADVLVVNADYMVPDDGTGLADMSSTVVLGTFEKTIGQRSANATGMGVEGNVDVWQVKVATTYKGNPGAVVHVMRWPDEVAAGQYHMTPGVTAVLFLAGPRGGLYTTVCGDAGLLLVGKDGQTLASPGQFVAGLGNIDQVRALF